MANERRTRIYLKAIVVLALAVLSAVCVWKKEIPKGLDLRGGTELRYKIKYEELPEKELKEITQRTIDIIRRRVDPEGNKEIDIRREGRFRFYIQLPGMGAEEAQRIENLIRRAGKLRFCLVNSDNEARARASLGERIPGHTPFLPVFDSDGHAKRWRIGRFSELKDLPPRAAKEWYLVENRARVTGEYLDNPHIVRNERAQPVVGFRFRGKGRRRFERLTEENQGRYLAIILDRDLYSAPRIRTRIAGDGIIEGNFKYKEVEDLVAVLRAGSLPADIELEWNNTVGAQLGEDSIRSGIRASIIAMILVVSFMALYYLLTGVIADFAVTLNLLLVLSLMALMQSVLTLPGIAGLVLTLGMAVDANVLINERIREERDKGKTLSLAIRNGYERAFVTILDSNLTTLITALILFGVGTGPVKGFALTLSFGIVVSMFTAIWVTRVIVDLLVEHGWLRSLQMFRLFGRTEIPFTRIRHTAMIASAVLIIFGLGMLARGWEHVKDTDLSGGVRAEIELSKGVSLEEFRTRVGRVFPGKSDVQAVWDAKAARTQESPRRFLIRVRRLEERQKLPKMRRDLEALLKEAKAYSSLTHGEASKTDGRTSYEFRATLSKGLSETALRRMLAGKRYTDSDIRHILLVDTAASDFVIKLRREKLTEDNTVTQIARVLDALKTAMASHGVRIKMGNIVKDQQPGLDSKETVIRMHLPMNLTEKASTAAVREALVRQIPGVERSGDLRVVGAGADQGAEICREVSIYGSERMLERILAAKKPTLNILHFSVPAEGEIRILTKNALKESDIRSRLSESAVLNELIRSVIPVTATGKEFVLSMRKLSEDKAVEQVKEDLLLAFSNELARDRVHAKIVPADSVPDLPNVDELKKAKYRFFALKLDQPMQLQAVQATLLRAGHKDALLKKAATAEQAADKFSEVALKLKGNDEETEKIGEEIAFAFANPDPFRSIETIGSVVAGEMKNKAILAVFLSWVAIVFYIWFRFGEVKFGLAAVTALVHDVLMTAGAVGVADALSGTAVGAALGFSDIKINVTMIAAFLTLIGYSINDTIVVFDRIRENMGGVRRKVDPTLVDASINQILSRTVLTSMTTFIVLVVLYIMGGTVIHGFAFVMTFGVLVGTYSSIFIASPILIGWEGFIDSAGKGLRMITFRRG